MSIFRAATVVALCAVGACSQLPAPPAQPASDLDALAARLGVAGSADYDSARAGLSRATAAWDGGTDARIESEMRELMKQTTVLDAMTRQRIPAPQWDSLIARAKSLAESAPRR